MVTGLYAVYDRLAEESGPVFMAPTPAVAVRQYNSLMKSVNAGSPEEYKLLKLGTYDSSHSVIEAYAIPEDVTPNQVVSL